MTERAKATRLKKLLHQRHAQSYNAFRRLYRKTAATLDKSLADTYPGDRQYYRWINGELANLPHPDHCAVLEAMFSGYSAAQLFQIVSEDNASRTGVMEMASRSSTCDVKQDVIDWAHRMELDKPPSFDACFRADSEPIDVDYVERMRAEIKNFVLLDQQYGGASAAPLIMQAYRQMRHRVRTSEIRGGLRRDVYSALSEVAEVAGWSLYDSDNDVLTEKVNNESLSLARMAGDRSMELFILQNMAMHAETIGRPRESINIARLVLETDRLSPRLEALFRLRLARAYGRLADEGEARKNLTHARGLFEDGVRDSDPHWAWWVNDAQLAWFEGSVRVDLGKHTEAIEFLELSANSIPEPRMNFIYRTWALFGYCLNGSWENVERSLQSILSDVEVFRSRRAEMRLRSALDIIETDQVPGAVRDLALALRTKLAARTSGVH